MSQVGPSTSGPTSRSSSGSQRDVVKSLTLDAKMLGELGQPRDVLELWKSVKPSGKYGLMHAAAIGGTKEPFVFDPAASLQLEENDNAPGRRSLSFRRGSDLDATGEAFVALLAERETIFGPADRMPYTFFVSPIAARNLRLVLNERDEVDEAAKAVVMEYMYSMTTGGPDDETLVDVNFYDRFVFVQAIGDARSRHYVSTLVVVDPFDERAPRVHVYHTMPMAPLGRTSSESDPPLAAVVQLRELVLDQLKFLLTLAGVSAAYQQESAQTTNASGQRSALEHLHARIKMRRLGGGGGGGGEGEDEGHQSDVLMFERMDIMSDPPLAELGRSPAGSGSGVPLPGLEKRGAATPEESLTYALLAAQFVSATAYHDDRRFMRRAELRRYPSSAWQTEVALSLMEAQPRESPLAFGVVSLPTNEHELLSNTMWHTARVMHIVDRWALSEFFFRDANKDIRLSIQPNDELNVAWLEQLQRINPCAKPAPIPRPVPGEGVESAEAAMRKGSVGGEIDRPATTATTVPEKRTKRKLDAKLKSYYRKIGAFFASPWHATSDGVEPSKKSEPGPGTSSYVENGWSSGYPIFRRLPLREDLFNYQIVRLMKRNKVNAWITEVEDLRNDTTADTPEHDGFSRLLAYLRVVSEVLGESDERKAAERIERARKEIGKDVRRLLRGAEKSKKPGVKNVAHAESLGPSGRRRFGSLYKLRKAKSGAHKAVFPNAPLKTYVYYAWATWYGFDIVEDRFSGLEQPKLKEQSAEQQGDQIAAMLLARTDPTSPRYQKIEALYARNVANVKAIEHKTLEGALEAAFSFNGYSLREIRVGLRRSDMQLHYQSVLANTWKTWERWSVLTNLAALGRSASRSVEESEREKRKKKEKQRRREREKEEKKKKKKKEKKKKEKEKGKEKVGSPFALAGTEAAAAGEAEEGDAQRARIEQKESIFAAFYGDDDDDDEMAVLAEATRIERDPTEARSASIQEPIADITVSDRLLVEREELRRAQSEAREFRDARCKAESLAVHENRALAAERYYRLLYYSRKYRDTGRLWAVLPEPRTSMERYESLMRSAEWSEEESALFSRLYGPTPPPPPRAEREIVSLYETVRGWQPREHVVLEWYVTLGLTVVTWVMVRNTESYLKQMDYDGHENLASVHALAGLLRQELVRRYLTLTNQNFPLSTETQRLASLSIIDAMQRRTVEELRKLDQAVRCVFVNNCPAPRTDVNPKALVLGLEAHPEGWFRRFLAYLSLLSTQPAVGVASKRALVSGDAPGSQGIFTRSYHENVFYSAHDNFVLLADQSNALSDEVPSESTWQTLLDMIVSRNPPGADLRVEAEQDLPTRRAVEQFELEPSRDPKRTMRKVMLGRTADVKERMRQHRPDTTWTRSGVSYLMACIMPEALHWIALGDVRAVVAHRVPVTTFGEGGMTDSQLDDYGRYLDEARVTGSRELVDSVRAYVETGADDPVQRAIAKVQEDLEPARQRLAQERDPRRRDALMRDVQKRTELLSALEQLSLSHAAVERYPIMIDQLELEEKPTLEAKLAASAANTRERRVLIEELKQVNTQIERLRQALEQWKQMRNLATARGGIPRDIVEAMRRLMGSEGAATSRSYERAFVPAATTLHQPHSLDGGRAEYTSWLLRNRGGRQVPLPHARYDVEELVCGLCPRTSSVGDWYLKSAEHQLEVREFTRAASRHIARNVPGARQGFDGDPRERRDYVDASVADALSQYRDAVAGRLPIVRDVDSIDEGRYAWQRDDEGIVLATGQFWRRVDNDTVAQAFFRVLYGSSVNAARPRILNPAEATQQTRRIEQELVELYLRMYEEQQEDSRSNAPEVYVKVFLLQIHTSAFASSSFVSPVLESSI